MRAGWRRIVACLCLLSTVPACARTHFDLATQRQEYAFTSTDKEVELGRRIARRVEEELTVVADEALQQRVDAIGQRLAAVSDRKEFHYHFAVVEDEAVNAFSLPGGYVFVYTGLIERAGNDEALAGVMAHEIAHIAARHAMKRYEGQVGLQLLQLATLATRQGQVAGGIGVAARAAQLAYARQDELEADQLGVKYLRAAGFNPEGLIAFLRTVHELDRAETRHLPREITHPQYARSHPFVPERLRAVKEALYGVADYLDYLNTPE